MGTYQAALEALADSTRRHIFESLRDRPRSVAQIAEGVPVSRPAVSQHLKVLRDSGLVTFHKVGNRNVYRVDQAGLRVLRGWLDEFWDTVLERYAQAADQASDQEG